MEELFEPINITNITPFYPHCFPDLRRNSCSIAPSEESKRTGIAVIRLVVSVLSIAGSLSIIISTIARKQIKSPKVFPIFMISIADGLLALTWIAGSIIWLTGADSIQHRDWCFLPSLLTVMLVCISANLTLVYAIGAYITLRRKNIRSMLSNIDISRSWKPLKTAMMYLTAWTTPVIMLIICFGAMEGVFSLVSRARACSCWCLPYFGNVLPLAFQADNTTAQYVNDIRNLVAIYGFLVGTQYLVVFILLVFFYWKILAWIGDMRRLHSSYSIGPSSYGSINVLLMKGHSQARKRIVYFLSIFLITGLGNVILSYLFAGHELTELQAGVKVLPKHTDHLSGWIMTLYVLQSLTAPLQGFLNAIVYGWTREEFIEAITHKRINSEVSRSRADSHSQASNSAYKVDGNGRRANGREQGRRSRVNSDSGLFQYSEKEKLLNNS